MLLCVPFQLGNLIVFIFSTALTKNACLKIVAGLLKKLKIQFSSCKCICYSVGSSYPTQNCGISGGWLPRSTAVENIGTTTYQHKHFFGTYFTLINLNSLPKLSNLTHQLPTLYIILSLTRSELGSHVPLDSLVDYP